MYSWPRRPRGAPHGLNLDFRSKGQCLSSQCLVLVCGTNIHPAIVLLLASPSEHLPAMGQTAHHSFLRNRFKPCQLPSIPSATICLSGDLCCYLRWPVCCLWFGRPGSARVWLWPELTLLSWCGGWKEPIVSRGGCQLRLHNHPPVNGTEF